MAYQPLKTPYVTDRIRGSETAPGGWMNQTALYKTLNEAVGAFSTDKRVYELRVCILPEDHTGGCADCWTTLARRSRKSGLVTITAAGRAFGI